MQYKVGVFDSGVGGLSVVKAIQDAFNESNFDVVVQFANDQQHVPYGSRQPDQIYSFVRPIFEQLIADGCQIIVVACNTVTTTLIDRLRRNFSVPLIGIEPMVKTAVAQTSSKVIAVCATPTTLASKRYAQLKQLYAQDIRVIEPDCSTWSAMIETNQLDHRLITDVVDEVCLQGADVIVLGCTHYHWIEQDIRQAAKGRAQVIQPEPAIIAQLQRVLTTL